MRYLLIGALIILAGCYSTNKATKDLNKIQNKYPELLASKAMQLFPVVERIDSFEVVKWRNSIINELEIDTLIITDTIDCDILKRREEKYIKTILNLRRAIVNPKTVIKYISDSTRTYLLKKELEKANADVNKFRKNYDLMIKLALAFLIALVLSLIAHIVRYYLNNDRKR
jgi:hypothetical protein